MIVQFGDFLLSWWSPCLRLLWEDKCLVVKGCLCVISCPVWPCEQLHPVGSETKLSMSGELRWWIKYYRKIITFLSHRLISSSKWKFGSCPVLFVFFLPFSPVSVSSFIWVHLNSLLSFNRVAFSSWSYSQRFRNKVNICCSDQLDSHTFISSLSSSCWGFLKLSQRLSTKDLNFICISS